MTESAVRERTHRPTNISVLLRAMRPKQWLKSGFVAAALVFSGRLTDIGSVARIAWAMLAFVLIGSAGYLLNDVCDVEQDRAHPIKRSRPVAAGELSPARALTFAAAVALCGVGASLLLGPAFLLVAVAYGVVTAAYSLLLKHVIFIDALAIAAGFVLRALGGAVAIAVHMSLWLGLLTALLATFIVLVKRRSDSARVPVPSVRLYPRPALDISIAVTGLGCAVAYTAYTFLAPNLPTDHSMALTVPFVAAGLARYALLPDATSDGSAKPIAGAPEEAVLNDFPLAGSVVGWLVMTLIVLYWIK